MCHGHKSVDGSYSTDFQLSADKSEVVFLGTAAQLRSVSVITSVDVAGSVASSQHKSLGVTIDSHLRFDSHARNVQLPHPRPSSCAWSALIDDVAQMVACTVQYRFLLI